MVYNDNEMIFVQPSFVKTTIIKVTPNPFSDWSYIPTNTYNVGGMVF
jgi:hypothetical protein